MAREVKAPPSARSAASTCPPLLQLWRPRRPPRSSTTKWPRRRSSRRAGPAERRPRSGALHAAAASGVDAAHVAAATYGVAQQPQSMESPLLRSPPQPVASQQPVKSAQHMASSCPWSRWHRYGITKIHRQAATEIAAAIHVVAVAHEAAAARGLATAHGAAATHVLAAAYGVATAHRVTAAHRDAATHGVAASDSGSAVAPQDPHQRQLHACRQAPPLASRPRACRDPRWRRRNKAGCKVSNQAAFDKRLLYLIASPRQSESLHRPSWTHLSVACEIAQGWKDISALDGEPCGSLPCTSRARHTSFGMSNR